MKHKSKMPSGPNYIRLFLQWQWPLHWWYLDYQVNTVYGHTLKAALTVN